MVSLRRINITWEHTFTAVSIGGGAKILNNTVV